MKQRLFDNQEITIDSLSLQENLLVYDILLVTGLSRYVKLRQPLGFVCHL